MLWETTYVTIKKQHILEGVLPRKRSALWWTLESVMPFQNKVSYTPLPPIDQEY